MSTMPTLEALLLERHPLPQWATFCELASRTGWNARRIDVAAFDTWPSGKGFRVAYEIKSSRSDFLRELKQPDKRAWVEGRFHETYFVCERDIVKESEVPEGWGLLVRTTKGDKLRRLIVPKHRMSVGNLPDQATMMLLRRACEQLNQARQRVYQFEGQELSQEQLREKVLDMVRAKRESLDRMIVQANDEKLALAKEREAFKAPLHKLRELAGGRSWYWHPKGEAEKITDDDVVQWFKDAECRLLKNLEENLRRTHRELDLFINQIEEQREEMADQC